MARHRRGRERGRLAAVVTGGRVCRGRARWSGGVSVGIEGGGRWPVRPSFAGPSGRGPAAGGALSSLVSRNGVGRRSMGKAKFELDCTQFRPPAVGGQLRLL